MDNIREKVIALWDYLEERKRECEYEAYSEVVDIQREVEKILGWRE